MIQIKAAPSHSDVSGFLHLFELNFLVKSILRLVITCFCIWIWKGNNHCFRTAALEFSISTASTTSNILFKSVNLLVRILLVNVSVRISFYRNVLFLFWNNVVNFITSILLLSVLEMKRRIQRLLEHSARYEKQHSCIRLDSENR